MRAFRKRSFMQVENYAGRKVSLGLGFVWPLWGCSVVLFALLLPTFYNGLPRTTSSFALFGTGSIVSYAIAAGAVFAFGLIDDIGGSKSSRGFKGHLKALAHGRLTTGALKLFGIGIAALLLSYRLISWNRPAPVGPYSSTLAWWIVAVILMGGSIALSANFVNLCDLRPGRATKVSMALLVVGFLWRIISMLLSGHNESLYLSVITEFAVLLIFLGPMYVTLLYDLQEQGMLGDAGANPSGFIAGAYIVSHFGLVGLIVYFVIMLALNLISEKVSFSRVIESNPLLSRLDLIGRIKGGELAGSPTDDKKGAV